MQANARVLLAEITGFDLDRREAHALAPDGEPLTLPYDSLIVAAGASHSLLRPRRVGARSRPA